MGCGSSSSAAQSASYAADKAGQPGQQVPTASANASGALDQETKQASAGGSQDAQPNSEPQPQPANGEQKPQSEANAERRELPPIQLRGAPPRAFSGASVGSVAIDLTRTPSLLSAAQSPGASQHGAAQPAAASDAAAATAQPAGNAASTVSERRVEPVSSVTTAPPPPAVTQGPPSPAAAASKTALPPSPKAAAPPSPKTLGPPSPRGMLAPPSPAGDQMHPDTASGVSSGPPSARQYIDLRHRLRSSDRFVRVFLSSTFADMGPEREAIQKSAVPRLRGALAARGLFFSCVDLRWGVTEEQVKNGTVSRICLQEVERCTYLLAFLKSRYGWHAPPGAGSDDPFVKTLETAAEEFPFLVKYADRSVTEHEIRLGAFVDPLGRERVRRDVARFWFASAALSGDSGEGERAAKMLQSLKSEIAGAGFGLGEYASPAGLAGAIHDAVLEMVARDFPAVPAASWIERELSVHAAFSASRRRLYVPEAGRMRALDAYAEASGPELMLVTGPDGVGKSALLANWGGERARRAGGGPGTGADRELVLVHHIGSGQQSARAASLARRVYEELRAKLPQAELPELVLDGGEKDLMPRFAEWLGALGAELPSRCLLVLDGLDQLLDREGAQGLDWLPAGLAGPRLRVVLSCGPGHALQAAEGRAHVRLDVTPLTDVQAEALVRMDLDYSGKSLSKEHLGRVLASPQCRTPLFVLVLLEELRASAVHGTLGQRLEEGLACTSAAELFALVIKRLEGAHGAELVRGALAAVACSRRGLAEGEIQGLLQAAGVPHSGLAWAEFLAASQSLLSERDSLLGFSHRYAEEAVVRAYLTSPEARAREQGRLGEHFAGLPPSARRAEEAPWQLAHAGPGHGARLASLLCEPDVLQHVPAEELARFWAASDREADAASLLGKGIANFRTGAGAGDPSAVAACFEGAARALVHLGQYVPAVPFAEKALEMREAMGEAQAPGPLLSLISEVGNLFSALGQLTEAAAVYERGLELAARRLEPADMTAAAVTLALISVYEKMNMFDRCDALCRRALEAHEAALGKQHPRVAAVLEGHAAMLGSRGRHAEAELLLQRALGILEKGLGGGHPRVAGALDHLAAALGAQGKLAQATDAFQRALRVHEATLGPTHPRVARSLSNIATLLLAQKNFSEAESCVQRAMRILERAHGPGAPELAPLLSTLARIQQAQEKTGDVERTLSRAVEIRASTAAPGAGGADTAAALTELAEALEKQEKLDEASDLFKKALDLLEAEASPPLPKIAVAARHLGLIYMTLDRMDDAEPLLKRALEARELALGKEHALVAESLCDLADLLNFQANHADAKRQLKRALAIREAASGPAHPSVAETLVSLAETFEFIDCYLDAEPLFKRAYEIRCAAQGPGHRDAIHALGSLVECQMKQGREEEAIELLEKEVAAGGAQAEAAAPLLSRAYEAAGKEEEGAAIRRAYGLPAATSRASNL